MVFWKRVVTLRDLVVSTTDTGQRVDSGVDSYIWEGSPSDFTTGTTMTQEDSVYTLTTLDFIHDIYHFRPTGIYDVEVSEGSNGKEENDTLLCDNS